MKVGVGARVRVRGGEGEGERYGEGVTVAMMNMSRHLAAPCTCCAAVCSIVGEVLLESPTSTARAHRLQDVEGRVRMGGFLGAARAGEGGGGRAVCVGVYVCAGRGGG